MSLSLILACLWALAGALVALLPMRLQYPPGLMLLIAAPVLLIFIGMQHGIWLALLCLAGFLSMFRNPLIYFYRKARGLPHQRPEQEADQQ